MPKNSVFDTLETARLSFQDLNSKCLDLQRLLSKVKKKHVTICSKKLLNYQKDSEKPTVVCVKLDLFDYFLRKVEGINGTLDSTIELYENVVQELSISLDQQMLDFEKTASDLLHQQKYELMTMELKYNKLIEGYRRKEKDFDNCWGMVSGELERTLKVCKQDIVESSLDVQDLKQTRMKNKSRRLAVIQEFEKDLKAAICKVENVKLDFPLKSRKLNSRGKNGDIDRNRLIRLKELSNNNNATMINKNNESVETEISVFLANQLNNFQEESRLNISMPKDEGKWDPALDSEKEENGEFSDVRKAFEVLEGLNLFEAENIGILHSFAEKCGKENKNVNSIDKAIVKELLLQLIKLQKDKKNKPIANNACIDDTQLNLSPVDLVDQKTGFNAITDTMQPESHPKDIDDNNHHINKKLSKNKDLSLSDLILDSSFLSPATGKQKHEDFFCKYQNKTAMMLIEEASSSKKLPEDDASSFKKSQKNDDYFDNNHENETKNKEDIYQNQQNNLSPLKSIRNSCKNYEEIQKSNNIPELHLFSPSNLKDILAKSNTYNSNGNKLSNNLNDFANELYASPQDLAFQNCAFPTSLQGKHLIQDLDPTLEQRNKYDQILDQMRQEIRSKRETLKEQVSFRGNMNSSSLSQLKAALTSSSLHPSHKNKSEVFRSTPNACFLVRNQSLGSQKTPLFAKLLKKQGLTGSNLTQTKLNTADFNKEVGFLQHIRCFAADDRLSEPMMITENSQKIKEFGEFSNVLNKSQKKSEFNSSFPGAKRENGAKRQVFVKVAANQDDLRRKKCNRRSMV